MSDAASDVLLNSKEVRRRLGGITGMTVHRWRERGILPSPVKIGTRNFWHESDIVAIQLGQSIAHGAA